jgi:voltage-gated potassium channel Kch
MATLNGSSVLIAGSGHLADRLEALLRSTRVVARVGAVHPGPLAPFEDALERANIRAAAALYVVDDRDAANVQFALAALKVRPELPITMALSNAGLVRHLQALHPNLLVINPWEIVTPDIVRALKAPASTAVASAAALPPDRIRRHTWMRGSVVLMVLAAAFATLLASATVFFHYSEQLDWITALYFVVTMATTTGFGDISLRTSSAAAKLLGIVTMISAIAFASVFFSLLVDRIVARRTEIILGRRRHRLVGHVIVCGLGRVGYHLVERLRAENYPVLVIERDADNQFVATIREKGIPVMIADATVANTLVDAAVDQASAVASVVNDDLVSLEVGLNARAIHPRIRVILRIFDGDTATELRQRLNIHYTISTSAIAAQAILEREAPTT